MKVIRTPEERFKNLPDYSFASHYMEVEPGLRLHYLDEGNKEDPVALLLHGEPSWSFLYRKMIPILASNGFRVITPDLIGFGKSDKPVDQADFTYQNHMDWLSRFIQELNLQNILLFCQDWGGLLGLRLMIEMSDRFSMTVAANTTLPAGLQPMPESWLKWRDYTQHSQSFNIGKILNIATVTELSEEVMQAYNAPFPSEEYKVGARVFPLIVPIESDDPESIRNREVWEELKKWEKPFLTLFGGEDDIMRGAEKIFQKLVPGAKGQEHAVLHAGHFLQEDKGEELAERIIEFYRSNVGAQ
ncbi:alpha/beta fold hydrolase [Flavobacteriaceae bacterium R33]|uniref:Alpha/beta fold hydrolase n=1 Tax=Poritiphilus flavus TaxID=2697053 RepID=A0A6L9EFS3_9FLAO|nr:alpha/beta fold hydrolase [Poritiphilus flavus]